jgi:inosine/xanthosine triphosphatase
MKIVIGGTFNFIHDGHKALFDKACEVGKIVLVGITSDEMAQQARAAGKIREYKARKNALVKFLNKYYPDIQFNISEITEVYNRPLTQEVGADAIVASVGKKQIIKKINSIRVKNNLKPLKLILVPYVLAEDCTPIKSTKIMNGEMDRHGRMLRPIVVFVGSSNKVKINAVRNIFNRIYPKRKVKVKGFEVKSGVEEQPFGDTTIKGAINRAKAVGKISPGKGHKVNGPDFGIGIEAGLIWNKKLKTYFDVQYCAVIDKMGKETIGHGPGFQYPEKVIVEVKKGLSIGETMQDLTGIKNIGSKKGAIGFLTKNILDRTSLTEQAVLMAMVPRIEKKFFGNE